MNELRRILRNQLRTLVGAVALGCLVHLQVAQAQEVSDAAFNRFRSQVVGNTVNFSYGAGGTPLGGAGNATGIGVTSGVDVSRSTSINTKHGPITGTLAQKVSSGAMAKAVGRVVGFGGLPGIAALLLLPHVLGWMSDEGVTPGGAGFVIADPTICTTAPCNEYSFFSNNQHNWRTTSAAACTAAAVARNVAGTTYSGEVVSGGLQCQLYYHTSGGSGPDSLLARSTRVVDPADTNERPASAADIEAALTPTNPSPEALAELYQLAGTMDLANPIPDLVDTLRADFEARSPESVETTTSESPTESKTEEKTCATYTQLVGSTLSLVEQCETTTTTQAKDPETGLPVGPPKVETSTNTNTSPDPTTKEDQAQDPCLTAPNRVACIELGTPTGEIPTATRSVQYQEESVFGGGTCPADKYVEVRGQQLRITDMATTCDMLEDYAKPIALLLAAFTALMIVAAGMPE